MISKLLNIDLLIMYKYDDKHCLNELTNSAKNSVHYSSILKKIIKDVLSKTDHSTPFYKILHSYSVLKWIQPYLEEAKIIRENFADLVVVSMGGASLNPQAMLNLTGQKSAMIKIHFLNNTDPLFFKNLMSSLDLAKTAFLTISNSGETLETIALVGTILNEYKQAEITNYSHNFYFITNPNDTTLSKLANNINAKVFAHDTEICGRFAGFTNVSTLVGLIAGLDMEQFLEGANKVLENFWQDIENSLPVKAAITAMVSKKPTPVSLGYQQRFGPFLEWYCQIIAESLGKDSKGFTPIRGIGPNDHHSMLQLYLDGPSDKLITMFHVKNIEDGSKEYKIINDKTLSDLSLTSLKKVNDTCFYSALYAFKENKIPVRLLILDDVSEKSVGALFAHCMIEIIILGHFLEVNPFNQPGVELIKKHAKRLLHNS